MLKPKLQPLTGQPFDNSISEALHTTVHAAAILRRVFFKNSCDTLEMYENTWLKFFANPLYCFFTKYPQISRYFQLNKSGSNLKGHN